MEDRTSFERVDVVYLAVEVSTGGRIHKIGTRAQVRSVSDAELEVGLGGSGLETTDVGPIRSSAPGSAKRGRRCPHLGCAFGSKRSSEARSAAAPYAHSPVRLPARRGAGAVERGGLENR